MIPDDIPETIRRSRLGKVIQFMEREGFSRPKPGPWEKAEIRIENGGNTNIGITYKTYLDVSSDRKRATDSTVNKVANFFLNSLDHDSDLRKKWHNFILDCARGAEKNPQSTGTESGDFSGVWINTIPADGTVPERTDRMILKQNGESVTATIVREKPVEDKRKWLVSGRIRSSDFFAVFWQPEIYGRSFGSWFVQQLDDDLFEGIYIRRDRESLESVRPKVFSITMRRIERLGNGEKPRLLSR